MASMAMIVVRVTTRTGFRRQRTQLVCSGLENESKDTCSDHKHRCKNSNLHGVMIPPAAEYPMREAIGERTQW
jgi:hypothetical protein